MTPVLLSNTELGEGQSVFILHGLFGRKRNWQAIQKRLADRARIITADMRNHGDSPWHETMTYDAMAADIAHLIDRQSDGPAIVVGHSMGGKAAMALALQYPELVKGLMVLDIAPVRYEHDYAPYITAMRSVPLASLSRRSEAEDYLLEHIPDAGIRAFLLQNLGQDDDGLKWQVNLDHIDDGMADILDFPGETGSPYDGPTTFLAGGASNYIDDGHLPLIQGLFPYAEHAVVEGAGHWLHAEKPAPVIDEISRFIDATDET